MLEMKFEIVEHIGVLSDGKTVTELNKVRWGNMNPMYDLRRWGNKDGAKVPFKGLVMNVCELRTLRDILNALELDG